MARRSGTIKEHAKGEWRVRCYVGLDASGRRVYSSQVVAGRKADAERILGQMLKMKGRGAEVFAQDRTSIGELLDDLATDYSLNGRDVVTLEHRLRRHLRPYFCPMRAAKLTGGDISRYCEQRRGEGAATGTINRELTTLRRAFVLGIEASPPKAGSVPKIKLFRESNTRTGFLDFDGYQRLLRELPECLKPFFVAGFFTGCRKMELLSLRWQNVDLERGTIRLDPGTTKTREGRTILMVSQLWEVLRFEREKQQTHYPDCEHVFHYRGKPMRDIRDGWDAAAKRAGLAGLLVHDLRRSAVRAMLQAGIPETTAMKITGHRTREIFTRYDIVAESDLRLAADRLGGFTESLEKRSVENSHHTRTMDGVGRVM